MYQNKKNHVVYARWFFLVLKLFEAISRFPHSLFLKKNQKRAQTIASIGAKSIYDISFLFSRIVYFYSISEKTKKIKRKR